MNRAGPRAEGSDGGDELLEVGHVGRAHGTTGEVRVTLTSDRSDRLESGSTLSTDRGELSVVASRPHRSAWLVRFAGVETREDAEALSGLVLRARGDATAEGLWVHQIVGLEVVDPAGVRHGTVTAVQANPAHDLLVLDDGTLVPVVFITEVGATVVVDAPEGLFG